MLQAITRIKAIWTLRVCFSVCCKSDVNPALGQYSKQPSSITKSTEASFRDDSNKKTSNVNKVCQQ